MNRLATLQEAKSIIEMGKTLLIAGEAGLLRQLPKGNWIGGTTILFMDEGGGVKSRDRVFVTELPAELQLSGIRAYGSEDLVEIVADSSENGVSFLLLPAFSKVFEIYAERGADIEGIFEKNIAGWIAGRDLEKPEGRPLVFDGTTGEGYEDRAVVLHAVLPEGKRAEIKILNVFEQGDGDAIEFSEAGFSAGQCLVNGDEVKFSDYIRERNIDTMLPLVADYFGKSINASIVSVEDEVKFFAPVFDGITYRFARRVDYMAEFQKFEAPKGKAVFCCNCVSNFFYGELEGKRTGAFVGPVTFGEIAYQLLNQTLVYVDVMDC